MHKKNQFILTTMIASNLFFSGILLAQAQDFNNPIKWNNLEELTSSFIGTLQGLIALLCIVFIVIGGIMYITSSGDEKMIERAKKTITGAMIGLAIAIAAPALLDQIKQILGTGGGNTLYVIIQNTLNFLLSLVALLAIIGMVTGGIFYITSAGDEERIEKGKKILTYSIVGITVALLGLVIVKAINYVITGTP